MSHERNQRNRRLLLKDWKDRRGARVRSTKKAAAKLDNHVRGDLTR
jgi:hypothetical protein